MYTAAGYARNDIGLGCTTIANIEFNAWVQGSWYTAIGYVTSDMNRNVISFVYTAIGYTNNDIK